MSSERKDGQTAKDKLASTIEKLIDAVDFSIRDYAPAEEYYKLAATLLCLEQLVLNREARDNIKELVARPVLPPLLSSGKQAKGN